MCRSNRIRGGAILVACLACGQLSAEDRETSVRKDLEEIVAAGQWIYNDLPRAFEDARRTGKPLLVVIRCIPCDACRGFDAQVAAVNPRVRSLLQKFVRVRVPQTNGLDLSRFQFDYDLSFFAFFLNADGSIYGRFGSPSTQHDKLGRTSLRAFGEALGAVLELHSRYDDIKESLTGKKGPAPRYPVPEEYPGLKGRFGAELDYKGNVVKSCIHCHMIGESERRIYRSAGEAIPDAVLFPWPLPDVFGASLDPRHRATVASVEPGSVAERAGVRAGDELVSLAGQPLVSIADVEWVLHHFGDAGELVARVRRDQREVDLKIPLAPGWRRKSDISWRVTTWDLRRMGTGGLKLEELSAAERRSAGIAPGKLALRVEHVGQYGDHATAKKAGFRKGDLILAIDGSTAARRETDFIAYAVQEKRPGDAVSLTVKRGDERLELSFRLR